MVPAVINAVMIRAAMPKLYVKTALISKTARTWSILNIVAQIYFTPSLIFFLHFGQDLFEIFHFHLGSHSQNPIKPNNFVKGFLRNLLKCLIAISECATRLTKSFIIRIASILAPKTPQNQVLYIRAWV